jgi:hypothetical protein
VQYSSSAFEFCCWMLAVAAVCSRVLFGNLS